MTLRSRTSSGGFLGQRSSHEIRNEIEKTFGFFPPFFEPAFEVPAVLENLWQQTLTAYIDNPIPPLFKEKLAAYLARFCTVPYCLLCHSSALRPLGMKSSDVLNLLQEPPLDYAALSEKTKALATKRLKEWPKAGSSEEDGILYCCVAIFLNQDTEECQQKLRDCLPADLYAYLNLFLAYNRTCLSWAEAHPELNYQSDKRVQDHYADLVADDPKLGQFFDNYQGRVAEQGARRERWLADENKSLFGELKSNQEWFAATLRGIGDAVIATDASDQPKVTFLNGVAEELTGWTNNEAKGQPVKAVFNIVNESTREEAFNPIAKVIATGKVQGLANHTVLIRKDGLEFVIEDSAAPIKNSSGDIDGVVLVFRDVTDKKRLERAAELANEGVKAAKQNLEAFFMQAPTPMVILEGAEHRFTVVNPPYERLIGQENLTGRTVAEVFSAGEAKAFIPLLDGVMKTGVPFIGKELPFDAKDEFGNPKKIWIDIGYHTFRDDTGKSKGVLAIVHDVSEQVEARNKLAFESHKLATVFKEAPAALALFRGPDFILETINQKWCELVSPRDYIGKTYVEAYPELANSPIVGFMKDVFETGIPFHATEMKVLVETEPGTLEDRYYDLSYVRTLDGEQKPYGLFCHGINVTDKVLARNELIGQKLQLEDLRFAADIAREEAKGALKRIEESEDKLRFALTNAKMGHWTLNLATSHIVTSDETNRLFGVDKLDPDVYALINSRMHPEDKAEVGQVLDEAIAENKPYDHAYRIVLPKTGEIRWILSQGRARYDVNNKPIEFTGIVTDITDRKNVEAEIRKAKEEAERANETKTSFLANMSHEIRTPLGAIIGFSELLRDESVDRVERRSLLDIINRNAKSLTRVIDDILDLSKVEAGKLDIELSPTSLREILHDVIGLFTERAKSIGLELNVQIPKEIPENIQTDPVRIRQILINIVGNAVKFTEKGSVTVSVEMMKNGSSTKQYKIAVRDTGRGLTNEQKEKLFQPFSQADNTTTREFGGTGLGLVLSRRLAVALGGNVEIENCEPGKGCTFAVSFSAVDSQHPPQLEVVTGNRISRLESPLANLRVLLVEDSPDNQMLIKRVLVRNGASVSIAENGAHGVNRALEGDFDIVLMDIQMPTMDGYAAMAKLKDAKYAKPVIALTAHAMEEERLKTRAAGFAAHVTKPVEFPVLIETIVEVIEGSSERSGN